MKNRFKPLSETNRVAIKGVAKFVVARSVSGVVVTLIHQNVTTSTKPQKAALYVGAYLIGSKVADVINEDVSNKLDSAMNVYNELFEKKDENETIVVETTEQ